MSIQIDQEKCIGCRGCEEACPGNLIEIKEGKASIRQIEDCWGCTACVKACRSQAISYYLGADIGGNGSLLYVKDTGTTLEWVIKKADGKTQSIIVQKEKSNDY
jgi:adenylylsulfate reductase, subunit B